MPACHLSIILSGQGAVATPSTFLPLGAWHFEFQLGNENDCCIAAMALTGQLPGPFPHAHVGDRGVWRVSLCGEWNASFVCSMFSRCPFKLLDSPPYLHQGAHWRMHFWESINGVCTEACGGTCSVSACIGWCGLSFHQLSLLMKRTRHDKF